MSTLGVRALRIGAAVPHDAAGHVELVTSTTVLVSFPGLDVVIACHADAGRPGGPGTVLLDRGIVTYVEPGMRASVRAGVLRIGGEVAVDLTCVPRSVMRRIPAVPRATVELLGTIDLESSAARVGGATERLVRSLCGRGPVDAEVRALMGRGPGLTPSGDDVLAGMLVVLHGARSPAHARLRAAVTGCLDRTTVVSASMLRLAADGFADDAVVDVLDALVHAERGGVAAAVARLCSVGATSGVDTLAGIQAGLAVLHVMAVAA